MNLNVLLQTNKIQQGKKYNLLMKKPSQHYFQQVHTRPSRTQSPDFKAGNSIRATKSPQNIQYILNESERKKVQVTAWDTPKKQPQTVVNSRYFVNNRSSISNRPPAQSTISENYSKNFCQNCSSGFCHCIHAANNEEVVIQLKKIITMINGASVSPFNNEGQDQSKQIEILKLENDRLQGLLEKYKSKSQVKYDLNHNYENEVKILRQQLSHNRAEHEKQREQLYRTSKTISSQYKSLEDKYLNYEKQLQKLRHQLKVKQQELQQAQESRKKGQEKLSLSLIKDQYNSSIKTLKSNLQFEVNNQLSDYESEIREYKMKIDILEQRLKSCEKVNEVNKKLNEENLNLRKQVGEKDITKSKVLPNNQELVEQNQQLNDHIKLLNKQIAETKIFYENQIEQLKDRSSAIEEKIGKDTQLRLKKLMENYEQQIKILKGKTSNHKGIEQQNQNLRRQNEENWQEVIKLRNELVNYTSQNARLLNLAKELQNEINKLNVDHSNFISRIGVLENQNGSLIKEAEEKLELSRTLALFQDENGKLKQDLILKQSNITNITSLENQNRELKHELERSMVNYRQLQEENNRIFYELDRVTNESNKKQLELRQNYKKQYDETKNLYQDQIHQIQQENKRIYTEYDNLRGQNGKLQQQIKNIQQNAVREKNQKIYEHQLTIRNLGKIIQETEDKLGRLEDNIEHRNRQNQRLILEINQTKQFYERSLKEKNEHWESEIDQLKAEHKKEIEKLKQKLEQMQNEEQSNLMKIKSKISTFSTESLKKELLELKKLVDQGRFERLEEQLAKMSEGFERQLVRSEQKTLEIDGLTKDKCALEDKVGDLSRMRLILEQKINILEGNNRIIENELKERKSLCDSLLNQKLVLQKQNLMLKKIKLDRESIEATKAKAREISIKIDKLLAMQQQRQNNIMQVSKTYTDIMFESKTKRI